MPCHGLRRIHLRRSEGEHVHVSNQIRFVPLFSQEVSAVSCFIPILRYQTAHYGHAAPVKRHAADLFASGPPETVCADCS